MNMFRKGQRRVFEKNQISQKNSELPAAEIIVEDHQDAEIIEDEFDNI